MKNNPLIFEKCETEQIDDILMTRFYGDFTLELAMKLQPLTNSMAARYGYRLLMINVEHLGAINPKARRYLAEDQKRERKDGSVAVVGATFAIRTVTMMLIKAVSVLSKIPVALEFFQNEEEAFAWLERERNRLRAIVARQEVR